MEIKTREKWCKTIHSGEDEDYSTSTTILSIPGTQQSAWHKKGTKQTCIQLINE